MDSEDGGIQIIREAGNDVYDTLPKGLRREIDALAEEELPIRQQETDAFVAAVNARLAADDDAGLPRTLDGAIDHYTNAGMASDIDRASERLKAELHAIVGGRLDEEDFGLLHIYLHLGLEDRIRGDDLTPDDSPEIRDWNNIIHEIVDRSEVEEAVQRGDGRHVLNDILARGPGKPGDREPGPGGRGK